MFQEVSINRIGTWTGGSIFEVVRFGPPALHREHFAARFGFSEVIDKARGIPNVLELRFGKVIIPQQLSGDFVTHFVTETQIFLIFCIGHYLVLDLIRKVQKVLYVVNIKWVFEVCVG